MQEGRKRHLELRGGVPKGWVTTQPQTVKILDSSQKSSPVLYGVVSTWFDADIIGANIDNCFEQGCSRVYVIDNASPDNTVEVAEDRGAIIAHIYETKFYDDDYRTKLQNELVGSLTFDSSFSDIWWMLLDADEFPCGPRGMTVIDYLRTLPIEVKVIGANAIDLYPQSKDEYTIGKHPAKCMAYGVRRWGGINRYCECGHWKHPFVRYFNGIYDLANSRGNHANALRPGPDMPTLIEPDTTITMFHAPMRRYDNTKRRLEALCNGRSEWDDHVTRNQGSIKRFNSLEAVYNKEWDKVDLPHTQIYGRDVRGLTLYPWRVLEPSLAHIFD